MAKDFVKLSEVRVVEQVAEDSHVLVEQNGEIYRAPKDSVSGGGSKGLVVTLTAVQGR